MAGTRRLVVIGGVAGGATFASKARRCCPDAQIEIYDQDEFISYTGCGLPYFIGGHSPNWRKLLARLPDQFEAKQDIRVFLRHRVNSIDTGNKTIRVMDLEGVSEFSIDYDKLVIATGASPFIPPIPGQELDGVFVLRSITNALEMKSFIDLRAPQRAVIVGAGAIGLEMCEALRRLGIEVHVVELADQVLPPMDADLASQVSSQLERNGLILHLGAEVKGLQDKDGTVGAVTAGAEEIGTEMVLLSIGIRPASALAEKAGIELGTRGAIRVDERMRTSAPDVLACGDCATTHNLVSGGESWMPMGSTARKQARVAAETAAGNESSFPGTQGTFILKAFEVTVGKTGLSLDEAAEAGFDADTVDVEDTSRPGYYRGEGNITLRVTVEKVTGRVLGAQAVGDYHAVVDKRLDIMATAIRGGLTVGDLSFLDLAYAPPYSHPFDLPVIAGNLAEARILGKECSCSSEGLEEPENRG
jgi:NADPH-dependent 2,4-dienoyl-CoA reductase/sulfur reductase-like enzyme